MTRHATCPRVECVGGAGPGRNYTRLIHCGKRYRFPRSCCVDSNGMSWSELNSYIFASSVPTSSAHHELTPTPCLSVGILSFNQPSPKMILQWNLRHLRHEIPEGTVVEKSHLRCAS